MFSYDCMRILLMMLDCAVVHSTATWVSNSLKGHPLVCNLGLQSFKGTYLATVLQSWFIGVRFFKAEICPGSHSLRGYQWSLKDSGARVRTRIARGMRVVWFFESVALWVPLFLQCFVMFLDSLCVCVYTHNLFFLILLNVFCITCFSCIAICSVFNLVL